MDTLYAQYTASITEVKRNLSNILKESAGNTIAILNHNKPEAYLVPAPLYEQLIQQIEAQEDLEDSRLIHERSSGKFIEVNLNDL